VATIESSRAFWEQKAKENPAWYISSFRDYHSDDLSSFWASGEQIWRDLQQRAGASPSNAATVVDIGCGIGRLARAIAPQVARVHCFDISREMLTQAESLRIPNATFYLAQGASLAPLPDKSADWVIAYNVLQHLPNCDLLGRYLEEMNRVARERIVFTTCIRGWSASLMPLLRLRRFLLDRGTGPSGLYKKEWSGIRPSRSRVQALSPVPLHCSVWNEKWLFWGSVSGA
jgi:SAM-dependent methyltransferase